MSLSTSAAEGRPTHVLPDAADPTCLLQLPESALALVLSKLEPCSLASTAASCRTLSNMVPAHMTTVEMQCKSPEALTSLQLWFELHNTSLASLTQCSGRSGGDDFAVVESDYDCCHSSHDDDSIQQQLDTAFCHLPCAQLRKLRVQGLEVQLAPAGGRPGLLQDCTGLTALELRICKVRDVSAGSAAIAALTELRGFQLPQHYGRLDYAGWRHHLKLTCLSLRLRYHSPTPHQDLCQLSALVNLQQLQLEGLTELPSGVPSTLAKLTCLTIQYPSGAPYVPGQFQHLASLTKLEVLEVFGYARDMARDLHGIQQLPALTELHICNCDVTISTAYTHNWTRKTMLRGLALTACAVQPEALAAFTQLRVLKWNDAILSEGASYDQLLESMAQLTHLEELLMHDA